MPFPDDRPPEAPPPAAAGAREPREETSTFGFALGADERSRDRLAELGQIAAGLVHEIKNPLGAIQLNAELLLGQADAGKLKADEKTITRLQRIVLAAKHLHDLSNAFLGFARPGKPDRDRVDVNEVLRDLLAEQAEALKQAKIEVSLRAQDDLLARHPLRLKRLRTARTAIALRHGLIS